jgi:single-stranded-DNA-specific exonuclease
VVARPDEAEVRALAVATGVRVPVAAALANRGVRTPEQAGAFLKPALGSLNDPSALRDMDRAVARTLRAIETGETVCVYGDYDADGMTSTALLSSFFAAIGHPVLRFVPDRARDGYGVNADRVRELAGRGVTLFVTVDCGISSHVEVELATSLGADFVVLDHHEPGSTLPPAAAVVNPHRADCGFPFKDLAAVGVAFYFAGALRRALAASGRLPPGTPDLRPLLDLVAVGTIADVVPLLHDNRVLATAGLKLLNESPRLGLKALQAVAGVAGRPVTAGTVAFQLAPRLNATGRLSDPSTSVALLLAENPEEATRHADVLDRENQARRQIEADVVAAAVQRVEADGGPRHKAIVVAGDGWHAGVVGIAASKLVEAYRRPAIVIGVEDGVGRGSCRSIRGFDIGAALAEVSSMLDRHGGHPMAAGLAIESSRIPEFAEAMGRIADRDIPDDALAPTVEVDAVVSPSDLDAGLLKELALLPPHGVGNPEPVFACLDLPVRTVRTVGRDQSHVQVSFDGGGTALAAIWFGGAGRAPAPGSRVDVAFTLAADDRTGKPRMRVRDLRPAAAAGTEEPT